MVDCESCHETICSGCDDSFSCCNDCGKIFCDDCDHYITFCESCNECWCNDCDVENNRCSFCETYFCHNCSSFSICELCSNATCDNCMDDPYSVCSVCGDFFCSDCMDNIKTCESCGESACPVHDKSYITCICGRGDGAATSEATFCNDCSLDTTKPCPKCSRHYCNCPNCQWFRCKKCGKNADCCNECNTVMICVVFATTIHTAATQFCSKPLFHIRVFLSNCSSCNKYAGK